MVKQQIFTPGKAYQIDTHKSIEGEPLEVIAPEGVMFQVSEHRYIQVRFYPETGRLEVRGVPDALKVEADVSNQVQVSFRDAR